MRVAVATATTPPRQATPTRRARRQNRPAGTGLPCPGRPSSAPGSPRQGRLRRRPGQRSAHLDPGHRPHDPWQLSRTRDQAATPTFPASPNTTTPQTTKNQARQLQRLDGPLHMSAQVSPPRLPTRTGLTAASGSLLRQKAVGARLPSLSLTSFLPDIGIADRITPGGQVVRAVPGGRAPRRADGPDN